MRAVLPSVLSNPYRIERILLFLVWGGGPVEIWVMQTRMDEGPAVGPLSLRAGGAAAL